MEAMKLKTVFLCLVVMGCLPAAGYADTLQEAIDEALLVPLATLEAEADFEIALASPEYKAAKEKATVAWNKYDAILSDDARSFPRDTAIRSEYNAEKKTAFEAITDMCDTVTEQLRVNKQLQAGIPEELDTFKGYVTQCVTKNVAGFSALMVYEVKREAKDQYAGLIEKCRQEETNTLGVLGYQFIWPCSKGYLDMIDEPLEPAPTEISPEPMEDSETLPKVRA